MNRGELYLVRKPGGDDPKKQRVMVIVSRQSLLRTTYNSVVCAPVFSQGHNINTEVEVGVEEGLKHPCVIQCDGLASFPRAALTHYIGTLGPAKLLELNKALLAALDLDAPAAPRLRRTPRRTPRG